MATQQSTVRATLPAPSTAAVTAPAVPVTGSSAPSVPVVVLRADVPVIEPYTIAGFLGGAALVARLDTARASCAAQLSTVGQAAAVTYSRATASGGAGATGLLVAKVVVKSGKAVLAAPFTASGDQTAETNTHIVRGATAEGVAGADLMVISRAEALFDGEGRFSGLKPFDLPLAGAGALAADAAAAGPVVVSGGGSAEGGLFAQTGQFATLSAAGTVAAAQGSPAGAVGAGGLTTTQTAMAGAAISQEANGQLSVVATPSFAPSGMIKSTPAWTQLTDSWTNVAAWAADTGAYPGSTINTDGVVAQTAKAAATLSASVVFTAAAAVVVNVTLRLTVNGSVVATGTATAIPASGSAAVNVSVVRTISAGDIVRVQAMSNTMMSLYNPTAQPNTASYVRIT
ncbi:hypothetical protein [Nocardia asteroides]|uniref:hypothetical protein n=1 Tax=Nocardia asteroides TaxID=1824 RepID=UPI0034148B67